MDTQGRDVEDKIKRFQNTFNRELRRKLKNDGVKQHLKKQVGMFLEFKKLTNLHI